MAAKPTRSTCTKCGAVNNASCQGGQCSSASNSLIDNEACKQDRDPNWNIYPGAKTGSQREITRQFIKDLSYILHKYYCEDRVVHNDVEYVKTKKKCSGNPEYTSTDGKLYRCIRGYWHYANRHTVTDKMTSLEKSTQDKDIPKPNNQSLTLDDGSNLSISSGPCEAEPIYGKDNCTVIGYRPIKYSEGRFGVWATEEKYPLTENCECEPIYGELAGERVRLHRTPSVSSEPYFYSPVNGVPNEYDPANDERKGAFVFLIGAKFTNITPPDRTPKPLCDKNPYSIMYVERTQNNKTVLGSGHLHDVFIGSSGGEEYAFPRHVVNSSVPVDVSVRDTSGPTPSRRAVNPNQPNGAAILHSPDFHLLKPDLSSARIHLHNSLTGSIFQHGHYARDPEPDTPFLSRRQQKGTRYSVNLSNIIDNGQKRVNCIDGITYAPANTTVLKGDDFEYPLMNRWRESSVYLQMDVPYSALDSSFLLGRTDLLEHEIGESGPDFVFTDYCDIVRVLPRQYGSPVGQAYIPLDLEGEYVNGVPQPEIEGLVGDSFVGYYDIKRTSYISDKVPNPITIRDQDLDGFSDGVTWPFKRLSEQFVKIIESMNVRNPGGLPFSGDAGEILNTEGSTVTRFGDIYFPALAKTNIFGFFNSDVPLVHRQTGADAVGLSENGTDSVAEVYAHRLKSLNRDSSWPFGSDWSKAFLNRFYIRWDRPPSWKIIAQYVLMFLFIWGIGIWIAVSGAGGRRWPVIIAKVFLAVAWIVVWSGNDLLYQIVGRFLGLDLIKPDRRYPGAQNGRDRDGRGIGYYSMREGRAIQFEDNYHRINPDYLQQNRWELSYGMSDPYNTCYCPDEFSNKILYSNKQRVDSYIDAWQNFQGNNYFNVSPEHGPITNIFVMGNQAYAHTTDMILRLERGDQILETADGTELAIGSGTLFRRALPLHGGVVEGKAGLLDPNAAHVTQWGYFFVDREARAVYRFDGQSLNRIDTEGMNRFLDENLYFELLKAFPDFECVDQKTSAGIGYSFGFDHEHHRLLLTKIDYAPKEGTSFSGGRFYDAYGSAALGDSAAFCNKSFTISYDLEKQKWISFHHYTPKLYTWDRFAMYAYTDEEGQWRFNRKGHYQTFFGDYYPFIVDAIIREPRILDTFDYQSIIIDNEAYQWKGCEWVRNVKTMFNNAIFYNSHQNSGELTLFNRNHEVSLIEASLDDPSKIMLSFQNRRWNMADIYDHLINYEEPMWNCNCDIGPRALNEGNIDYNKTKNGEIAERYEFSDSFLGVRFYFDKRNVVENPEEIKFFLKYLQTQIDQEIDTDAE